MNNYKIPKECLNDPQFVKNFISTMCREISKKEEMLSDGEKMINKGKEMLRRGLEERAPLKPLIQVEREKKCLLESTLQSLNAIETQLNTQLVLISARLDEESLRDKIDLERYNEIVEMHKTIWLARQAEYEELPVAVERHKMKIEFQMIDIQLMVLKQKKKEYEKMIKIQENINALRLTRKTVKMVEMLCDRWEKQRIREELKEKNAQMKREIEALAEKKTQLLKLKEEEERSKLKARQLMQPPKLDLRFMKSFYSTGKLNREREAEKKIPIRFSIDSDDNASITTEIIENMCEGQDDITEEEEEAYESTYAGMEKMSRSISGFLMRQNRHEKNENRSTNGIEVLEKTYRELSLEKDDNRAENFPIEIQMFAEGSKENSHQKLQAMLRKSMDQPEGLSEAKRVRLEDISKISEREYVEKLQDRKNKSEKLPKKNSPVVKNRQLPQVQSIEAFNRPIVVTTKPLVAEIPPTPSNLFSPGYYATSSFGSIDNFESAFNPNFDTFSGPETPFNNKMDRNFAGKMDWENVSPPQTPLQSEASFTSNISAFKNPDEDGRVQQSYKQSNVEDSTFSVKFRAGTFGKSFFSVN